MHTKTAQNQMHNIHYMNSVPSKQMYTIFTSLDEIILSNNNLRSSMHAGYFKNIFVSKNVFQEYHLI